MAPSSPPHGTGCECQKGYTGNGFVCVDCLAGTFKNRTGDDDCYPFVPAAACTRAPAPSESHGLCSARPEARA